MEKTLSSSPSPPAEASSSSSSWAGQFAALVTRNRRLLGRRPLHLAALTLSSTLSVLFAWLAARPRGDSGDRLGEDLVPDQLRRLQQETMPDGEFCLRAGLRFLRVKKRRDVLVDC